MAAPIMKKSEEAEKIAIRTTIVIPAALDQNLEVLRVQSGGLTKNDLIKEALSSFVLSKGLEPDKFPVIQVSYV